MTEPNKYQTNVSRTETSQSGQSRFVHGQVLAERYKVDTVLGIGGMGVVYKVEQIFLRKICAMKTLEIEDSTGMFLRRFQQEGAAVSRLDHPNVVKIYDFGLLDGKMPFYVMDFIDGISLAGLLKKRGSLNVDEALKIFIRVSMALQHAHETNIIHRDIKPSNMMLQSLNFESDNCIKLVDFGIAKLKTEGNELQNLTRTGDVFGSPLYMSPEQCLGIGVDHRTDVYSFGCALFEALTGSPPHMGENSLSTMIKHREESAPTLAEGSLGKQFSPDLEAVVAKLLRKNPDERYQNFAAVTEDLNALKSGKKTTNAQIKNSADSQTKKSSTSFSSEGPKQFTPKIWWLLPLTALALISTFAGYALRPAPKQATAPIKALATPVDLAAPIKSEVATRSPAVQEFYDTHQLHEINEKARCYDTLNPYSTICINAAHQKVRVFQFPNEFSLGLLEYGKHRYAAKGDVIVIEDSPLAFTPSYECCERPCLLDKFRPDDIDSLSIIEVESANDEVMAHIDNWKALKMLNIKGTEISDRGLRYLNDNAPITDLRVAETPVTGKGIASLKWLSQLERVEANMVSGSSNLLKGLVQSKHLQYLDIRRANLTDDDMKILAQITSLKSVDISDNQKITDKGIQYLDLPNLRWLGIKFCKVTEASFPFLKKLPHLRYINVGPDWLPEKEAILHQYMPSVEIQRLYKERGL